ncbi:hypothetical protein [Vibrio algivorus]|uniref:Uncharacterized protein n=1 Tax=Vibrio algivorus TaxID=1667024 RepID=A0ABQ6ELQ5_9VIBR|nr:hypothetical protein [Vibrio algivorus]GLT13914.1 hypothetical protein GCM10007931_08880 [Vibrio algivorus]
MKLLNARIRDTQLEVDIDGETLKPTDVTNVSAGQEDSDGFLLMGDEFSIYLTNTQLDAQFIVDKAIGIAEQAIAIASKNVVTKVTGGSGGPAVGTIEVLAPDAKSELESIKQDLEDLKLR